MESITILLFPYPEGLASIIFKTFPVVYVIVIVPYSSRGIVNGGVKLATIKNIVFTITNIYN